MSSPNESSDVVTNEYYEKYTMVLRDMSARGFLGPSYKMNDPGLVDLEDWRVRTYVACCVDPLRCVYAWAIPSVDCVGIIREFVMEKCAGKVVEMGSGTGYWARCLHEHGVNIVAYDMHPCYQNTKNSELLNNQHAMELKMTFEDGEDFAFRGNVPGFFPVWKGGPDALRNHPSRALFLCWPPQDSSMAVECLHHYTGNFIIYVGELPETTRMPDVHPHGLNANAEFFLLLREQFRLHRQWSVPRHIMCGDVASAWIRKEVSVQDASEDPGVSPSSVGEYDKRECAALRDSILECSMREWIERSKT